MGFWRGVGLWVVPWVGWRLGFVDGGGSRCGLVVVRGWFWVRLVGFSGGWIAGVGASGLGFGLGLGFGVARILLGQTVPDQ